MPSDNKFCTQCGKGMFIDDTGVSHHIGEGPDGIDYDADGDHVPYDDGDEGADALDGDCFEDMDGEP